MELKKELLDFLEANNNFGLIEGLVEGIVDTYISAYKECNKSLNEQRGYSEEEVRLAYFQGEKDSYVKGGQTKEMENEFIQSLQQKHALNKSE